MSYTRVWVNNAPAGGQASNTADDEIRNLRLDVEERVATLVTGWSTASPTDPIVVLPQILGNVTGKRIHFHHSMFVCHSNTNESRSTQYVAPSFQNGSFDFFAPLLLPVGVTIQSVNGIFDRQGSTITFELAYTSAITGAFTSVSSVTDNSGVSIFTKSLSALAHVVATDRLYMIHAILPGLFNVSSSRLYGAYVVFDVPDCRNTL